MPLDFTRLRNSIAALERSLAVAKSVEGSADAALRETVREGVIQGFEVAYELSWKFMKRRLEGNPGGYTEDGVSRRELYRIAAENRLIADLDAWMAFHHARNETSHTHAGFRRAVAERFELLQ